MVPYNGLLSLCANFPKFHKCAHNPSEKIYSRLLFEVQLWIAIAEFGTGRIMSRSYLVIPLMVRLLKIRGSTITSTNTKNLSGQVTVQVCVLILQAINVLHDKGSGTLDYIRCAQLLQMNCEYCADLQTS